MCFAIGQLFPNRKLWGVPALALITGISRVDPLLLIGCLVIEDFCLTVDCMV